MGLSRSFHVSVHASQGIGPKSRALFHYCPYSIWFLQFYAMRLCVNPMCHGLRTALWDQMGAAAFSIYLLTVSWACLAMFHKSILKCVKCSTTSSCHLLQITDCTNSPLKHPSIQVDARLQGHGWIRGPPSWPPAPLWVWVATTFFSEGGFEPWDRGAGAVRTVTISYIYTASSSFS